MVHYGLHCPVFKSSVGVLAMSGSECDSVFKLKIFDNKFCKQISQKADFWAHTREISLTPMSAL